MARQANKARQAMYPVNPVNLDFQLNYNAIPRDVIKEYVKLETDVTLYYLPRPKQIASKRPGLCICMGHWDFQVCRPPIQSALGLYTGSRMSKVPVRIAVSMYRTV